MAQLIGHAHLRLTQPPNGSADVRSMVEGISAVVQVGAHLWLACDETATLERLTHLGGGRFGEHRTYQLADLLDLPGGKDEEVDVEGLAWSPPYLWLVGSHGRTRSKPDEGDAEERIARLAKVSQDDNRYLLARIPLEDDPDAGGLVPRRACDDPDGGGTLTAARLRGDGRGSMLMEELAEDEHLRRFLKIPGKDNGFDVEGLAAKGNRLFLGLRGPVLRGHAVVLEVEARDDDAPGLLRLRRIGPRKRRYRKHFLDLEGLGIRELGEDGDDLLVLAGPTMDVRAPAALYRWRGALRLEGESITGRDELEKLMELPHDVDGGYDHPEGVCVFELNGIPRAVLVAYDAASPHRRGPDGIRTDVFALR